MKTIRRTETMWAIAGRWQNGCEFLYSGTARLRKDAIRQFCSDMGETWDVQRKRGRRAVKVKVAWTART